MELNRASLLRPPATVGLIAPASMPIRDDDLSVGIEKLRTRGITLQLQRREIRRVGYLAGTDEERASELNAFLNDPECSTLFCVRGGYGVLRILDRLDYAAARRNPKLLVGYSDITALQLALFKHAGWASISGPMVAVEWKDHDPASEDIFWRLASGELLDPLPFQSDCNIQRIVL